jgi:predicted Zn-dependent protease
MTARGDEVVERALALSHADGCIVLAEHRSGANLRWAGNTLTTNGETRGRSVTVISVVGQSVGVRSATSSDGLEDLVRASEQAARDAEPAEDAGRWSRARPPTTSPSRRAHVRRVFERFAPDLGAALTAAGADGLDLYGFASHDVTTTWLGSSTGLRLRHTQPDPATSS